MAEELKVIGRILTVLAIPILIISFVLLNLENKNLPMIGLLLGVSTTLLVVSLIISHLPQEHPQGKKLS